MSYQWFNRQKLLQKAKDRYHSGGGKEKAAEHYIKNREFLSEKEKKARETYQRQRYQMNTALKEKLKDKKMKY